MDQKKLQELAQRYLEGTATEEEKRLLHEWYDKADEEDAEVELVFTNRKEGADEARDRMLYALESKIEPVIPARRPVLRRMITTAAALLVLSAGGLLLLSRHPHKAPLAKQSRADRPVQNDVAPGQNKATLVLGNGRVVVLDDTSNGAITQEGGVHVDKQHDKLTYRFSGQPEADDSVINNVITTPKGGQYQVVLADGTIVWLNAASSIRFPTAFKGADRRIEVSGEAYFEIARNPGKPFRVFVSTTPLLTPGQAETKDELQVEVLGTRFDVMSYDNERSINTTLLEGSVKVIKGGSENLLKPGEQATYDRSTLHDIRVSEGDEEQAVAWKNGLFQFKEADLQTIMRQIARWYDVDISYKGDIPKRYFTGEVPRNVNVSKVLEVLELSDIHFRIEGRVINVLP
jgi:ferric-dicitrate binding protein FerR (iron transport regulator)